MGCFSCFGRGKKGEPDEDGAQEPTEAGPAGPASQLQLEVIDAEGLRLDDINEPCVEVVVVDGKGVEHKNGTKTTRSRGANPVWRQGLDYFELAAGDDYTAHITVYANQSGVFKQKKFLGYAELIIDPSRYLTSEERTKIVLMYNPDNPQSGAFFRKHAGNIGSLQLGIRTALTKTAEIPRSIGSHYGWAEASDGDFAIPFRCIDVTVAKVEGVYDPSNPSANPRCYVEVSATGVASDSEFPHITPTVVGRTAKWDFSRFSWDLHPETHDKTVNAVMLTATVYVTPTRPLPPSLLHDPALRVHPDTNDVEIYRANVILNRTSLRRSLFCPIRSFYQLKTPAELPLPGRATPPLQGGPPFPLQTTTSGESGRTPQPLGVTPGDAIPAEGFPGGPHTPSGEPPGFPNNGEAGGGSDHPVGVKSAGLPGGNPEGAGGGGGIDDAFGGGAGGGAGDPAHPTPHQDDVDPDLPPPPEHHRAEQVGGDDAPQRPSALAGNIPDHRVMYLVIRTSAGPGSADGGAGGAGGSEEMAGGVGGGGEGGDAFIPEFPDPRGLARQISENIGQSRRGSLAFPMSTGAPQSEMDSLDLDLNFSRTLGVGGGIGAPHHLTQEEVISRLDAFFASVGKKGKDSAKILASVDRREIQLYERLAARYKSRAEDLRFLKDYHRQRQQEAHTHTHPPPKGTAHPQRHTFFDPNGDTELEDPLEDDPRLPPEERLARALRRERRRDDFVEVPESLPGFPGGTHTPGSLGKTFPEVNAEDADELFLPADISHHLREPPPRPGGSESRRRSHQRHSTRHPLKALPSDDPGAPESLAASPGLRGYEGITSSQEDRVAVLERELRHYKGTCERLMRSSEASRGPPFQSGVGYPAQSPISQRMDSGVHSMYAHSLGPVSPGLRPGRIGGGSVGAPHIGHVVGYHQEPNHHTVGERDMHSWLLTPPRSPRAGFPEAAGGGGGRWPSPGSSGSPLRGGLGGVASGLRGGGASSPRAAFARARQSVSGGGPMLPEALQPVSPTAHPSGWRPSSVARSPSARRPWR